MKKAFIAGCGYVGERLAKRLQEQGFALSALTHSDAAGRERLRAAGIEAVDGDLDLPDSLPRLDLTDTLLYYFAPPPSHGIRDPRLNAFLQALSPRTLPRRIVLLSTTGVYGDCGGAWINEEQPLNPQVDRARRRLHAEQSLRRWAESHAVSYCILRVPGIYGPRRLPEARLRKALPVLVEEASPYSNRIYIDDLVRVCAAAAEKGRSGAVYHVSDGEPGSMTQYFQRTADVLGLPRPPALPLAELKKQAGAGMLSYLAESKRLDIRRMREELGVTPHYDLARGLAQAVREQGGL